jgi:hypothetical protein
VFTGGPTGAHIGMDTNHTSGGDRVRSLDDNTLIGIKGPVNN